MREMREWLPREVSSILDEFRRLDRLLKDFWGTHPEVMSEVEWRPAMDLEETDDDYIVQVELPGLKKEDIEISVSEDHLTIKGERKREKEEKGKRYHRIERWYGKFERTVRFPTKVDPNKAKAEYKAGVLRVTLPKLERAKPHRIEIKVEE